MTKHFIEWENKRGYTIVLSKREMEKLITACKRALITAHEEVFEDLDVDWSPILDRALTPNQ